MLRMTRISKSFGSIRANRDIELVVPPGRIVGLLGENGSGKTTLMNILFGMIRPDAGHIDFDGCALEHHTPREALAAGIGMIHQHFMLVPAMTVTDNVMLGWAETARWLHPGAVAARIRETSTAYGLGLDPGSVVASLPLGTQQRVEVMKAILRGARLLVLDEPTSSLSPPEVSSLLDVLRRLRAEGRSVIFISHKLGEILDVCDEVVVLRDGEVTGRAEVAGVSRQDLARMMVGRDVTASLERMSQIPGRERLVVNDLTVRDRGGVVRLHGLSFSVRAGEVLALAGVDGNGQAELADVVAGLARPEGGHVFVEGADVTRGGVAARLASGLAHVPADRATEGLVREMTVAENLSLRDFDRPPLRRGPWLDESAIQMLARERMAEYDIRAGDAESPVATLSGGNQQKIVLARELGRHPKVLLAVQPTRGLDPGATRFVIERVLALREAGAAVLYISSELEEALAVGDRIGVLHAGRLVGLIPRARADITRIGLMMAGALDEAPGDAPLYGTSLA
jgi:simple sugar transport system ATP-binding protein